MAAHGSAATTARDGQGSVFQLEGEAHALADRLPELVLDALRVANTVAHGIHGRRRAGTGSWRTRRWMDISSWAVRIASTRRSSVPVVANSMRRSAPWSG